MSRKHFQRMATAVGMAGRDLYWSDYLRLRDEIALACAELGSNFDRERFFVWADEVQAGVRDCEGRLVA